MEHSHDLANTQPDHIELVSQLVALVSISLMACLFGIKTYNVKFAYLTYSRWLVLVLYINSWAFIATAVVLASTNNGNHISCLLSELACDVFYAGTKLTIYFWLIEKVWVVSAVRKARLKTKTYKFHLFLMTPYILIFGLMILFHIAEVRPDGSCFIGLQAAASIPLLVYDFIFNLYMTILFIRPLLKVGKDVNANWKESRLRKVAHRTLIASVVCLLISLVNILALATLNGRERGVICLMSCTIDVTINVITIHWVTNNPSGRTNKENTSSTNPETLHATFNEIHEPTKSSNRDPLAMDRGYSAAGRYLIVAPDEEDRTDTSSNETLGKK